MEYEIGIDFNTGSLDTNREVLSSLISDSVKRRAGVTSSSSSEQGANLTLYTAKLDVVKALLDLIQRREFRSLSIRIVPVK